jgi:pilus assembly protein CpaE
MSSVITKDSFKVAVRQGTSSGEPIRMVTVGLGREMATAVERFAESTCAIQIQEHLADYAAEDGSVPDWSGNAQPDICLIDFDRDRQGAVSLAERIHSEAPLIAIFAISSQSQPDLIVQAMRSGSREYLLKPLDPEQLLQAVARVSGSRKQQKKETGNGQVFAFIGAKGGSGVTTLVTQMGALLAKTQGKKTLILDLHPEFGDAALYLGLRKFHYHSFELLQNTDRLDNELLQSFVLHHPSGVDVVPAPQGAQSIRDLPSDATSQLLDFLRARYDFILVDLPPGLSECNLELVRCCDFLHLITVAEISAIRNVVHHADYCSRNHVPEDKVRVILNRYQKRSSITESEIEKVIRNKIFWKVPNQYSHVMKTIHTGDPVGNISNSDVTRNLQNWANTFVHKQDPAEQKREGQGILGLFSR